RRPKPALRATGVEPRGLAADRRLRLRLRRRGGAHHQSGAGRAENRRGAGRDAPPDLRQGSGRLPPPREAVVPRRLCPLAPVAGRGSVRVWQVIVGGVVSAAAFWWL